jgi:hypothetical protein
MCVITLGFILGFSLSTIFLYMRIVKDQKKEIKKLRLHSKRLSFDYLYYLMAKSYHEKELNDLLDINVFISETLNGANGEYDVKAAISEINSLIQIVFDNKASFIKILEIETDIKDIHSNNPDMIDFVNDVLIRVGDLTNAKN